MTFNSYELTEKYITVFSQYKEIEKRLQEEDDCKYRVRLFERMNSLFFSVTELEKLNITDEVMEVSTDAFTRVNF